MGLIADNKDLNDSYAILDSKALASLQAAAKSFGKKHRVQCLQHLTAVCIFQMHLNATAELVKTKPSWPRTYLHKTFMSTKHKKGEIKLHLKALA